MRRHCILHFRNVALDSGAQFPLPPQFPQLLRGGGDAFRHGLAVLSHPAQAVQLPAMAGQCVHGGLQSVGLHGKLFRRLNAIFCQLGKLRLLTVKTNEFFPCGKCGAASVTVLLDAA